MVFLFRCSCGDSCRFYDMQFGAKDIKEDRELIEHVRTHNSPVSFVKVNQHYGRITRGKVAYYVFFAFNTIEPLPYYSENQDGRPTRKVDIIFESFLTSVLPRVDPRSAPDTTVVVISNFAFALDKKKAFSYTRVKIIRDFL